ncbi:MAG: DUF2066 domain-containing protein [Kiloniellales bacterium]|nr:DUF2066 domain-containing protein [Kiloniellales bacterium]
MRIRSLLLGHPLPPSRRLLTAALFLLAGLGLAPAAVQAQSDLYAVSNIPVDATDDNAASARVAAHDSGHLIAFEMLVARLVPEDEIFNVPQLDPAGIGALVQEFSVDNERTSAVRYLATLNFRFNPEAVRNFLGSQQIPFAEIRSEPVLILPILEENRQVYLWRQPNQWRRAWDGFQLGAELVPMLLPLGDLTDISTVKASQALAGDTIPLESLAQRYNVSRIYLCHLVLGVDPSTGLATAELTLRRFGALQPEAPIYQSHLQREDESRNGFLQRIARAAIVEITEVWKQQNLLRLAEQSSIMVTVPVTDLGQWLQVKERLDQVVTVVESELAYMTRSSVDLKITYVGGQDQLTRALAQQELRLTQDLNEGWWRLDLASASASAIE